MEKHKNNAGAQCNPRDYVESRLETTPPQHHADRRPKHQAVILAKHEEEHAGADLPAGHPIPAVQIKCDGAFTDLLVHQRKNVGAGANGQDICVADFGVEPINHTPNHKAVEYKIKETIRNHQHEPARPADILKAS